MSGHANVAAYLRDRAADRPNDLAVAVARPGGGFDRATFAELQERVERTTGALRDVGIGAGVRTALMVPPSVDFFALTFALLQAEAVPVLIDPGLGVGWVRRCLAEAEVEAFVGVPKAHLARRLLGWGGRFGRGHVRTCVSVADGWAFGGRSLRELERRAEPATSEVPHSPSDRLAAILFTSGSTGPPKGALYTHGMFAAQVEVLRDRFGIEPGERDLSTFPLFALFGPALGMASVVPDMDTGRPATADPEKLLHAFRELSCTNLFASPALIDKLGRFGVEHPVKLGGLRRAISAGAPMSIPVLERFVRLLEPGAQLHTPYGATEGLPIASIGSDEILADTAARTEAGAGVCVGRTVGDVEARILRVTDQPIGRWAEAEELAVGEIGEITVRGSVVSRGYANRPEADAVAKIVDDEGSVWHRTGDVGYLDERGRLWMCGRKSHRVETAAGTLYSVPCEAIFERHPKVRRSALVGVPGAQGQRPVIVIELEREHRAAAGSELTAELLALGREHEHTRTIETVLYHPDLPVDVRHNAKIFREKLAPWATRQLR